MDRVKNAFSIYTQDLMPFIWLFEYENGLINELQFKKEAFPHLLALDKLSKYSLMKDKNMSGVSSICLHDLKKGRITDELISKDQYNKMIERKISNFDKLPLLLDDRNTQHFIFDKSLIPSCTIDAEYMLYNPINNIHCHFGSIETRTTKGSSPKKFSPITWFVEEDRPDKYIKDQTPIVLKNVKKELKANYSTCKA